MNATLQVYHINKQIEIIFEDENNFDEETGEFLAQAKIDALEISKEQIYNQLALVNIQAGIYSDALSSEIKRLQSLKKSMESKVNASKKLLSKMIPAGIKYDFGNVKISWRKSEEVIASELLDLKELYESNPDLVKLTYELKKQECKNLKKASGVLPEGITILEKQNIQIK